jgi:hypothetical protein
MSKERIKISFGSADAYKYYLESRLCNHHFFILFLSQSTYIPRVPQGLSPGPNWDPHPLSRKQVCPPPEPKIDDGGGGPNSDDWRKSLALCLLCVYSWRLLPNVAEGSRAGLTRRPALAGWRRVTQHGCGFVRDRRSMPPALHDGPQHLPRSGADLLINVHKTQSCATSQKEGMAWYSSRPMPHLCFCLLLCI